MDKLIGAILGIFLVVAAIYLICQEPPAPVRVVPSEGMGVRPLGASSVRPAVAGDNR